MIANQLALIHPTVDTFPLFALQVDRSDSNDRQRYKD
jgi:hypothetical protein